MLSSDLQKLSVTGCVTLYELDATKLGAGIFRWHGHVSHEDWRLIFGYLDRAKYLDNTDTFNASGEEHDLVRRDIIWQGKAYSPVSIQSDGLEVRGDGRASTPTLTLASDLNGVVGLTRVLCLKFDDFAGAKLTVRRTLVTYLDAANFTYGNPQADPTEQIKPQLWYVEQKTSENEAVVTFELSNPVDFAEAQLPSRMITSYCHWATHGDYRGEECGYTGAAMFTDRGIPTVDPEQDRCGGRTRDCECRFGKGNTLRHGGFPSSNFRI